MRISEMGLTPRAYNVLVRNVPMYEMSITAEDVIEHIPRLSTLTACGLGTMVEIIDTFDEHGYKVKSWQAELRSISKTESEKKKIEDFREKRMERKKREQNPNNTRES